MTTSAQPQQRDIADAIGSVGRSKGWLATYGALTTIAGVLALALPGTTLLVIAVVFAVQLFIFGVYRLVTAFATTESSAGSRVLYAIVGILSILVGILCLRDPLQTIAVLTLMLGAFWLIAGIVELFNGVSARGEKGRGWAVLSGIVGVVAGIVVLSYPVGSAVTLAWLLGILLILHGVIALGQALSRSTTPAVAVGGAQPASG